MDEAAVEAVILAINALGAGILLFVSGVVQRIMNDMDEREFRTFTQTLVRTATSDPFAVTIGTIPILALIFYFVRFGFGHWWFTAGIVTWMIGSTVSKIANLPVYEWVGNPANTDAAETRRQRRRLELGNHARAWLTLLSVVLMACQFSVTVTALAIVSCLVIAAPTLWLARWYFHN